MAMEKQIPTVSTSDFDCLMARDPAMLLRSPYVVEGFVESWPAFEKWRDLAYLAKQFGHLPVKAGAPQFVTYNRARMCEVSTTFSEYLTYIRYPDKAESLFRNKWIKGTYKDLIALGRPLYSGSIRFVQSKYDPVLQELQSLTADSVEYWNDDIPYFYQLHNHVWLYVSLKGALTPLHADNNGVMSYLAQLKGIKKTTLFCPEDKMHYFKEHLGYVDLLNPNQKEFPTWQEATPWVATLYPGQLLIWGPNWAHHVISEQNSISISIDIVNKTNIRQYSQSKEWMTVLGRIVNGDQSLWRKIGVENDELMASFNGQSEWQIGKRFAITVLNMSLKTQLPPRSRKVRAEMLRYVETS